jgi:hypothetical protein
VIEDVSCGSLNEGTRPPTRVRRSSPPVLLFLRLVDPRRPIGCRRNASTYWHLRSFHGREEWSILIVADGMRSPTNRVSDRCMSWKTIPSYSVPKGIANAVMPTTAVWLHKRSIELDAKRPCQLLPWRLSEDRLTLQHRTRKARLSDRSLYRRRMD